MRCELLIFDNLLHRKGVGEFSVVLIYEDREHFQNSARQLASAGFPLD